jgi:hypothetical protein
VTLSALALAAAISLLLGHAVSVASSAVILAGARDASEAGGMSPAASARQSWRTTIATAALAFGAAVLLLSWSAGPAEDAGLNREALTVVPSGVRLRVIAIDGFDARIFDELAASGGVPALTATVLGTRARLESRQGDAGDPARVWTTIATGQPPEYTACRGSRHGVAGIEGSGRIAGPSPPAGRCEVQPFVRLTRLSIAMARTPRQDVLGAAGLRTSVVNWWATWPAPRAGVVLSDRVPCGSNTRGH